MLPMWWYYGGESFLGSDYHSNTQTNKVPVILRGFMVLHPDFRNNIVHAVVFFIARILFNIILGISYTFSRIIGYKLRVAHICPLSFWLVYFHCTAFGFIAASRASIEEHLNDNPLYQLETKMIFHL